MKINWLNRVIAPLAPHLCLCLSDAEYQAALKDIEAPFTAAWISDQAHATVHVFENDDGASIACIVCMGDNGDAEPVDIATILVHEAVHIWQIWCRHYGEDNPGDEQEAYAIQLIANELMSEYARRLQGKTI